MRRTRHPLLPATALAAVVLSSCGPSADQASRTPGAGPRSASTRAELTAGEWTRLPDSPLSPREGSAAAHVPSPDGDLAVFVGGYTGQPCPPNADCVIPEAATASDGAAYNLGTGAWEPIADAPRPVPSYSPTAVIDDTLYVLAGGRVLAWDAGDDAWTVLEAPVAPGWAALEAHGDALVVVSGSDENGIRPDQVYETGTGTWSRLPSDPLKPSFDRVLVATPAGLVLTAKPIAPDGGPEDPALVQAALLPDGEDRWRTLPSPGDQLGGWHWTWTGRRLVDPTPGGADGGEVNNFGRTIPYGGALDPATGTWTSLRGTPDEFTGGWPVEAAGSRYSAVQGWVYDDGDARQGSSWTRLEQPGGAPGEPGPGVWVDDMLVVAGGADWDRPDGPEDWTPENVWSSGTWAYRAG